MSSLPQLQQMKREGRKIVAVVVYDYQMAQIVDRAGVDIVSVGDSVGVNMWGQESELDVTLDQMLLVCKAVRRGVKRAIVSCDFPYGPMQESLDAAVGAARKLVDEGGADMLKLDAASDHPDAVRELTQRCTDVLEMYVRRYPNNWLWMHRRWRDLPRGEDIPGMFQAGARDE